MAADQQFVAVWAALFDLYSQMDWLVTAGATPTRYERARHALAVLECLAPTSLETAIASGRFADACARNWRVALRTFELALPESPNDRQRPGYAGFTRFQVGRHAKGIETARQAFALDPLFVQHAADLMHPLTMLRRFLKPVERNDHVRIFSLESVFLAERAGGDARPRARRGRLVAHRDAFAVGNGQTTRCCKPGPPATAATMPKRDVWLPRSHPASPAAAPTTGRRLRTNSGGSTRCSAPAKKRWPACAHS